MDKDRQIRMLVPPFFMLASVLWGAYLGADLNSHDRDPEEAPRADDHDVQFVCRRDL